MYFSVNHTGCNERKGLVEIRYDLYLDPSDHKYSEHHVQVPVIPAGGYTGKVDVMGQPLNQKDYDKWFATLPRVWQNNPFCCHFCQFEPDVTDEEILYVGELALDMAYKNWVKGNLHLNKNQPVSFSADSQKKAASQSRVASILSTDFVAFEKTVPTNYSIR
jgi:hypothetical protein